MLPPVGDAVGSPAGGGLGSLVDASSTTTVIPVEVDTPSGPVMVLVICEVMEVVLLEEEAAEGAAVVGFSELVGRVVCPVDEGPVVEAVVGAAAVVVGRGEVVEAVLRLLVVVVFDCRFTNSTRRVASAARSWWMTSRARRSPGNTPCLNLGPL